VFNDPNPYIVNAEATVVEAEATVVEADTNNITTTTIE
jgi:hypothetical protein